MKDNEDFWLLAHSIKNEVLLMQCGEALENSISAMMNLGAPSDLCELVEAKDVLRRLNGLFGLKEGVYFSTLLEKMNSTRMIEAIELVGQN